MVWEVFSALASVDFSDFEAFSDFEDASLDALAMLITLVALAEGIDFSALADEAFATFASVDFPALSDK